MIMNSGKLSQISRVSVLWRKLLQNAKFVGWRNFDIKVYSFSFFLSRFGFGEDDEANLFGMYGTPEDKAKIVRPISYFAQPS